MNRKDIEDLYSDDEPDMLFADGYDEAIAGVVWDGERTRVVYKPEKILQILMNRDKMTYSNRNPVAREVRTEKYNPKVVPDKHKEQKENDKWKEMISYLKSLS